MDEYLHKRTALFKKLYANLENESDFTSLALEIFDFQYKFNEVYRTYVDILNIQVKKGVEKLVEIAMNHEEGDEVSEEPVVEVAKAVKKAAEKKPAKKEKVAAAKKPAKAKKAEKKPAAKKTETKAKKTKKSKKDDNPQQDSLF